MIRRFAIDVAVAIPAVIVAGVIWFAILDSPLLYAIYKDQRR